MLLEDTPLFAILGLIVMAFFAVLAWWPGHVRRRSTKRPTQQRAHYVPPSNSETPYRYRIDWPNGAVGTFGSHLNSAMEVNAKNKNEGTIMVSADRGESWAPWTSGQQ